LQTRLKVIDSLRGIAILGVVSVHTSQFFTTGTKTGDNLISSGRFGVQLFFLLSAFSLALSWNRSENKQSKIKFFYLKRVQKIVPLFFISALYYFFVSGNSTLSLQYFILLISFAFIFVPEMIVNIIPGSWSIGIEFLFYLIFPFVMLKIRNRKNFLYLFSSMFIVNCLFIEPMLNNYLVVKDLDKFVISNFLYLNPFNQISVFTLGLYLVNFQNFQNWRFEARVLLPTTFIVFVNQFLLGNIYKNTGILFLLVILGLFLLFRLSLMLNFKSPAILQKLGKFSYEIYFAHFVVLAFIDELIDIKSNFIIFLSALLLTLLISLIISHVFDFFISRPINVILNKLVYKL
jgi:peptidoglycan/LPS O-acetylase OafA/YrhL